MKPLLSAFQKPDAEIPATAPATSPEEEARAYDPGLGLVVNSNAVSADMMVYRALSHLNRGAQGIKAARNEAADLRKEYEKAIRNHGYAKLAALTAESLLMAYYGYGAIEHYTGYKGTLQATLMNSAISGGISVTRAGVQYGLMKRGEEALKEGSTVRGVTFVGIGLGLALINTLFVAIGFANKFVTQEQELANQKLHEISESERLVHDARDKATSQITSEINELDKKIAELRSGNADPRIAALETQMKRIEEEIAQIRNHPNYNDGKETEWDRVSRADMARKSAQLDQLNAQKMEIIKTASGTLSGEQQAIMDASVQRRAKLVTEMDTFVEQRFKPQLDALATSRKFWEVKLGGAAGATGSFSALTNSATVMTEALANVAAISVANWFAATEGYKQETLATVLSGIAQEDPWAGTKPEKTGGSANVFMGYDTAAGKTHHMQNERRIEAILAMLQNPEAVRAEIREEVTRMHGAMVQHLHALAPTQQEEEYKTRLENINRSYENAMATVNDNDTLIEIKRILREFSELKDSAADVNALPVFSSPDDPGFKTLAEGAAFKTPDGQLMKKSTAPAASQPKPPAGP